MADTILAWHFTGAKLRDGRAIPPDGEWLVHDGPVRLCRSGLHASERAIDALTYAPGVTVCRVECRHILDRVPDKFACRERRILWRIENTDGLLREFARKAALSVIDMWDAPDIVRRYLETGDEAIRAAASDAAWAFVRDVALPARVAEWAAAMAAMATMAATNASAAAEDAARDAMMRARAAARAAAKDAKVNEFNETIENMINEFNETLENMIKDART